MHHIRKPLAFIIPLVDLWRPSIFKPSVEGLRPSVRHSRHGSIEVVPRRPQSQWRRCQFPRWTFARHCHHRRRPLWRQEQIPGKSQVCGEMPRSAKTQLQGWPEKKQKIKTKKKTDALFVVSLNFSFFATTETRQESIFLLKKKDTLHPTFSLVVSHPSSLLLSHCISLMC